MLGRDLAWGMGTCRGTIPPPWRPARICWKTETQIQNAQARDPQQGSISAPAAKSPQKSHLRARVAHACGRVSVFRCSFGVSRFVCFGAGPPSASICARAACGREPQARNPHRSSSSLLPRPGGAQFGKPGRQAQAQPSWRASAQARRGRQAQAGKPHKRSCALGGSAWATAAELQRALEEARHCRHKSPLRCLPASVCRGHVSQRNVPSSCL